MTGSTSKNSASTLLNRREFNEKDSIDFVVTVSGHQSETNSRYHDKIQKVLENFLQPDIDTTVYTASEFNGDLIMRKQEGNLLYSRRSILLWMLNSHINIIDEYQNENFFGTRNNRWMHSSYLTLDAIVKLSRKDSLTLEEIVQVLHLDKRPVDLMPEDMIDTWDTMYRLLDLEHEGPPTENSLFETSRALTSAARKLYPIPRGFVHWINLPVEDKDSINLSKVKENKKDSSSTLLEEPFVSPPTKQDEWCEPIFQMMYDYRNTYGKFPDKHQAWSAIWKSPPNGFGISNGKDSGHELALCMGGNTLSKGAFSRRFKKWSTNSKP